MTTPENRAAGARGGHTPVMLAEVLACLAPRDDSLYIDGTFGAGGYARAILESAECRVIAIDRDPEAVAAAADLKARFPGRLEVIEGRFGDLDRLLEAEAQGKADGVTLDLGVSSQQIDQPQRGFSFQHDGPLDMRMEGAKAAGLSAADLVRDLSEADLADLLYRYGDEKKSRRVARAIVAARKEGAITRTGQLAEIIRRAVRPARPREGAKAIDPATRSFQALRIAVNDELGEVARGLEAAERALAPGGRLVVVAFHSLEDRLVKDFLRRRSGSAARGSRHQPEAQAPAPAATFEASRNQPVRPGASECARNPRARSARLRWARRTDSPPWEAGQDHREYRS